MNRNRPRVIFDCNALFRAFLAPHGPAWACVRLVEERRITLVLSTELMAEARDVLSRPFVRERFPDATPDAIELFLGELLYLAELWRSVPHIQVLERDPDDELYLNLSIAAEADYIVTRDKDLLSLTATHTRDAKQFRQLSRNQVQIVTPDEFLERLGNADAAAP